MHEMMKRLYQDHRNLSRLYDMLEEQVGRYGSDSDSKPDLLLILDIITYLNDYPKVYHHPLEEEAIGLMTERKMGDHSINELIHKQHHNLEEATERVALLFNTIANDQPVPIDNIRDALDTYLDLSRKHLQAEEEHLFPEMEQLLGDEEWQIISSRLPEQRDPLFVEDPDEAFAELKSRLENTRP